MNFIKGLEKVAIVGPLRDLQSLGLPSIIGYQVGRTEGMVEGEKEIDKPSMVGKLLRGALIPGYIGYRYGKGAGHKIAKTKKEQEEEAKKHEK